MIYLEQFPKTGATKFVSFVEFYFKKENGRKPNNVNVSPIYPDNNVSTTKSKILI